MTDRPVEVGSETRRTALGTLLIERGQLDEARLEEALAIGEAGGERLGEVLVRLGWVSEEELAKTLADQWHLRYTERSAISFDREALRRMSREDAAKLEALPIQVGDDGVLSVALAEPTESRLMALRTCSAITSTSSSSRRARSKPACTATCSHGAAASSPGRSTRSGPSTRRSLPSRRHRRSPSRRRIRHRPRRPSLRRSRRSSTRWPAR